MLLMEGNGKLIMCEKVTRGMKLKMTLSRTGLRATIVFFRAFHHTLPFRVYNQIIFCCILL